MRILAIRCSGGYVLRLLVALSNGLCMTLQSAVNTRFKQTVGSGVWVAWVSYSVGLISVTLVSTLVTIRQQDAFFKFQSKAPLYAYFGGIPGCIFVCAMVFIPQHVGFALFFACTVTVQLCTSTAFDHHGFLGLTARPVTPLKMLGLGVAIVGCILTVAERASTEIEAHPGVTAVLYLLSLASGVLMPTQTCVNRKLSEHLTSKPQCAVVSFLVGDLGIACAVLVDSIIRGFRVDLHMFGSTEPWMYFGGVTGVSLVYGAIVVAPRIGMTAWYICSLAGNLTSSLLFDHFGALGNNLIQVTALRLCGICLVFCGACIAEMANVPKFNGSGNPIGDAHLDAPQPHGLEPSGSIDCTSPTAKIPENYQTSKNQQL